MRPLKQIVVIVEGLYYGGRSVSCPIETEVEDARCGKVTEPGADVLFYEVGTVLGAF
jgi:hypothetical protein